MKTILEDSSVDWKQERWVTERSQDDGAKHQAGEGHENHLSGYA